MFKIPSLKRPITSEQTKRQLLNSLGWDVEENFDEGENILSLQLPSETTFKITLGNNQYIELDKYLQSSVGRMTQEDYSEKLIEKGWYWIYGRQQIDIREDYNYIQKKAAELCREYRKWRIAKRASQRYYY